MISKSVDLWSFFFRFSAPVSKRFKLFCLFVGFWPFFFYRYTNDINPFGDSNLTEQFVWGKKREKEGNADQTVTKKEQRDMQKKNVEEIEKVLFDLLL